MSGYLRNGEHFNGENAGIAYRDDSRALKEGGSKWEDSET